MQSFLQYRRFGRHVAAQYERDKSKAEALGNSDRSNTTSPFSSNADASSPAAKSDSALSRDKSDTRDPEKAEQSSGSSEHIASQDYAALEKEKTEQPAGKYEPIRATPSGNQGSFPEEEANHMSRATTAKSMGIALGTTLTGIEVRDRSTKEGGEGKVFVVGYEGEKDIMNPHNWSKITRFGATYVMLVQLRICFRC